VSGYVLLYRRVLENPVFKTQGEAMVFAWLVLRASWKPSTVRYKGKIIELQRSQLAMSVRDMAEHMEWSKSRVSRFLNTLSKWDMIKTTGGTAVNIITICKYDDYQLNPEGSGTVAGQPLGQERDSSGTQNNKENKLNEDIIPSLRSGIVGEPDELDDDPEVDDDPVEEIEKPDSPQNVDQAIECWNLAAKRYGWPTIKTPINGTRRGKLQTRLREKEIEGWKNALRKAWGGYLGRDPPAFFTFDWLIKNDNNIDKVLDGNYDRDFGSSGGGNQSPSEPSDPLLRASQRFNERFASQRNEGTDLLAIPDARTGSG
jgi:hypothetical protein